MPRSHSRDGVRPTRLTARGWTVLAVGIVAVVLGAATGRSEGAFLGCFCLALLGGAALAVRARRPRLSATRSIATSMPTAGAPFEVVARLRNVGAMTTAPLTLDEQLAWPPFDAQPVETPTMAPERVAEVRYTITAPVRGETVIGPLISTWADPFGLVVGHRTVASAQSLLIAPMVTPLPESPLAPADGGGVTRSADRRAVGADDDHSTREYRTGDALRRVHWRASARLGELMVRQEEPHSHPEALLVLDTAIAGWPDAAASDRARPLSPAFEWAVAMIASLGIHLVESGYRVATAETTTPQLESPAVRRDGAVAEDAFLASLARVRPMSEHAPQHPEHRAGHREASRAVTRGPVFAVVSTPTQPILERLARERAAFDLAVVFVVDAADETVADELRLDGWTVVPVTAETALAEAWADALADASAASFGALRVRR